MSDFSEYKTIRVRLADGIVYLQLYRPDANNTINGVKGGGCQP